MALLRSFTKKQFDRPALHDEIQAKYGVFERDGRVLIQIDTYGRKSRDFPEKVANPSSSTELALKHYSKS